MTQNFYPQILSYTTCAQPRSTGEILLSKFLKRHHLFKESRCKNPGVLSEMVTEGETESNSLISLNDNIDQMSLFCQKNPKNKTKTEKSLAKELQQQIE